MATCSYSFNDPLSGENIVLTGQPAIKNYLFNGGLEALLPELKDVPALLRGEQSMDAAYMDAVKRNDTATMQKLVDEAAEKSGLATFETPDVTAYSIRRTAPPTKTQKAYKAFFMRDGKLYPLYVGAKNALPVGTWLDAKEGGFKFQGANGIWYVTGETGTPAKLGDMPVESQKVLTANGVTKEKASRDNKVFDSDVSRGGFSVGAEFAKMGNSKKRTKEENTRLKADLFAKVEPFKTSQEAEDFADANGMSLSHAIRQAPGGFVLRTPSITLLAYRPGWHTGTLPFNPQGAGAKDGKYNKDNPNPEHPYAHILFPNVVIAEVELAADKDYQQAFEDSAIRTKDGKIKTNESGLREIPKDGFYNYTTNANNNELPGDWLIGGSLKINRILTQDEINARMDAAGVARQLRVGGDLDLKALGFNEAERDGLTKLRDPKTYDDNGKVIPLSERFNPKIEDPRFSLPDDEILDTPIKEKDFKTQLKEFASSVKTSVGETQMGAATVKQLGELVNRYSPEIATFIENNSQHLALKSRVLSQAARQVTNKWQALSKADARLVNNLVRDSDRVSVHAGRDFFSFTMPYRKFLVDAIDKAYEDQEGFIVGTQVKIPAENLVGTPFENLLSPDPGMFVVESEDKAKELQPLLEEISRKVPVDKIELERRARWKANSDRFKTLSQEQKDVYTDSDAFMRALYDQATAGFVARFREALVKNSDTEAAIAAYTLKRNASKVMGYYSPALRRGEFYFYGVQEPVAGETEGAYLFTMFRTEAALEAFEKSFRGEKVSSGKMLSRGDKTFESAIGVDDGFMKQMQDAIFEGVSDPTEREALRDEVFMQYLKSLPEVSMRKHNIHRKQTAGAENNAMAAFANYARHGASQLAGITYNDKLRKALRAAERVVDIFQSGVVEENGKKVVAKDSIRYKTALELKAAKELLLALNGDLDALYDQLSADESETGVAMFNMFRSLFSGTQVQILSRLKKIPGTEDLVKSVLENPMTTNERLAALTGDELTIFRQVAADVFDINSAPENVRTRTKAEIKASIQAIHNSADRALKTAGHIEKLGVQKTFINVLEELKLSYQAIANSQGGKLDDLVQVLNQATFFMMIGFGTSTALINTLQVGMVAVPIMAGRYKSTDVALVLAKNYKIFFSDLGVRDEDGELSMTPTLKKIISDPNTSVEEREILSDLLNAMTRAKAENDISLSLSHEAARISDPDYKDTALTSLVTWSGWMMHHAERLNREVTFATAFLLARDPKYKPVYEHQEATTYANLAKHATIEAETENNAFEYARYVNYTAHGDYSTENAARFFRGNIGRTATQFMKYEQQAYWNYGRMAYITIKGIKSPKNVLTNDKGLPKDVFEFAQQRNNAAIEANDRIARQEAWRTLSSMAAAQIMAAGTMSLPLIGVTMGMLTIAGAAVGGDDDEPWDTEKELQMWLVNLLGKEEAEMFMNGTVNALTPINLASRMDLANIAFREPLVEKEAQDEANYYLARIWGPTGAIATNFVSAWDLAKKGEKEGALEKVMPKVVTDILKAARYSDMPIVGEGGYRNKRGELVKKMSATEIGLQALGFTSSEINRTMTEMHYIKGEEHDLTAARSKIVGELAEATIAGEPLDYTAVREWNGRHPEFIIKPENVKQSVQSRKTQEKNRDGTSFTVNPKLSHLREKYDLTY